MHISEMKSSFSVIVPKQDFNKIQNAATLFAIITIELNRHVNICETSSNGTIEQKLSPKQ